jgi:uncharacterized membrane protein YkvA (DUF1232 family)
MIRKFPSRPQPKKSTWIARMIPRSLRIVWRLLRDDRVPLAAKIVPLALLLLLFSPPEIEFDLILPLLGILGAIVIIAIGLKLVIWMSPYDLVLKHTRDIDREG